MLAAILLVMACIKIHLWRLGSGRPVFSFSGCPTEHGVPYPAFPTCVSLLIFPICSPSNLCLFISLDPHLVKNRYSYTCRKLKQAITSMAFDHEDQRLLVGCNNGRIRLFNYGNGHLLKQVLHLLLLIISQTCPPAYSSFLSFAQFLVRISRGIYFSRAYTYSITI